ncbi:hypothetical protein VP01_679g1 [Puccinia sorghi]|uniref:Uncharacterized protein n=1 Tax=Puccinia sorghi TaxID=27349 RepID=A0A0L6UEM3_9BASI|nr:hypothetical protein VP01_679g1 [Puccinia sorghi]
MACATRKKDSNQTTGNDCMINIRGFNHNTTLQRKHAKVIGGAVGVAHDWQTDFYEEIYWKGLINIKDIAKRMGKTFGGGQQLGSSGPPNQSSTSQGKKRFQSTDAGNNPAIHDSIMSEAGPGSSMNVD